jgi:uncharacterized membrane protein
MRWNQWYSLKSYLRSSLWIVPFIALLLYLIVIHFIYGLTAWLDLGPLFPWSESGTQSALETIITMTLTFMVFTFGSLLVAVQVASGQLTPRIIATTLLRDNAIRLTVGLFSFTLIFATGALARQEAAGTLGVRGIAGVFGFGSIVAFLYLIDYAARLLRPVSIVWIIGEQGLAVIESVYPDPAVSGDAPRRVRPTLPPADQTVYHRGKSAIVLAVNLKALVAAAENAKAIIEVVPRVGDFVATGEPLFRAYGGTRSIDERWLAGMVAFGPERTIEQDSTFAFRIIVDVAIKALSKAINDPTTAVLAIDQLQRLIRAVGKRQLLGDEILDESGQVRVIHRTPNWEDFVQLTFSELRLYGAENFQVARRLRAMLKHVIPTLPEHRRPALLNELDLLDRSIEARYTLPSDLALARVADVQGLGGATRE